MHEILDDEAARWCIVKASTALLSQKRSSVLLAQTYLVGRCHILLFLCLKITFLKAKGERNCGLFFFFFKHISWERNSWRKRHFELSSDKNPEFWKSDFPWLIYAEEQKGKFICGRARLVISLDGGDNGRKTASHIRSWPQNSRSLWSFLTPDLKQRGHFPRIKSGSSLPLPEPQLLKFFWNSHTSTASWKTDMRWKGSHLTPQTLVCTICVCLLP